ncbi:MAG TPA: transcriptional regulator [Candidatus Bathyarchaeia archaeon]|jgi:predicted DNA-binding transcriptional regulator|nr:transcriptional regulator [Candidatus Bathyarchaeia archaeon]
MKSRRGRGRILGFGLLGTSFAVFITYSYVTLFTSLGLLVLKLTIIVAVGALLAVLAWIGYTMTTAPPQPETDKL